jgi:outer membrane putative beta-barrel porin/alpha-amylase
VRSGFCAGLLVALALPAVVKGQDLMQTPIGFRTGLTEGAVITRLGTLTIDAGASIRWAGDRRTLRLGEFNIRVPFNRRIEGRFYGNSLSWQDTRGDVAAGREDLAVALAAMLTHHRGARPVSALIVRLDTPTGTLPGRETSWRPGARLSLGWELPGRIALHTNLGMARDTRAGRAFDREIASVWMARRLAGPFGGYVELFGSTREQPDGSSTGYLHGGLTWQVRSWMHLDLHGGVGSAGAGSPRWIGIGVRQRA